ncbi:hypothetical protein [Streptomyces lavendulae]|uniref:hypothetical protein n=1 Tax=Streptomyces lavendulae TaxID=1914 RepID=UPI0037FCCBE9
MDPLPRLNAMLFCLFRWPYAWMTMVIIVVVRLVDRCRTPRVDFSGFEASAVASGAATARLRKTGRSDAREGLQARHA